MIVALSFFQGKLLWKTSGIQLSCQRTLEVWIVDQASNQFLI
jgi:hypothetical protein